MKQLSQIFLDTFSVKNTTRYPESAELFVGLTPENTTMANIEARQSTVRGYQAILSRGALFQGIEQKWNAGDFYDVLNAGTAMKSSYADLLLSSVDKVAVKVLSPFYKSIKVMVENNTIEDIRLAMQSVTDFELPKGSLKLYNKKSPNTGFALATYEFETPFTYGIVEVYIKDSKDRTNFLIVRDGGSVPDTTDVTGVTGKTVTEFLFDSMREYFNKKKYFKTEEDSARAALVTSANVKFYDPYSMRQDSGVVTYLNSFNAFSDNDNFAMERYYYRTVELSIAGIFPFVVLGDITDLPKQTKPGFYSVPTAPGNYQCWLLTEANLPLKEAIPRYQKGIQFGTNDYEVFVNGSFPNGTPNAQFFNYRCMISFSNLLVPEGTVFVKYIGE